MLYKIALLNSLNVCFLPLREHETLIKLLDLITFLSNSVFLVLQVFHSPNWFLEHSTFILFFFLSYYDVSSFRQNVCKNQKFENLKHNTSQKGPLCGCVPIQVKFKVCVNKFVNIDRQAFLKLKLDGGWIDIYCHTKLSFMDWPRQKDNNLPTMFGKGFTFFCVQLKKLLTLCP